MLNNLGLALGANFKVYTRMTKGLNLKVRKFCGLSPMFVEVTEEKLVGGTFFPPILNRDHTSLAMQLIPLLNNYEPLIDLVNMPFN